MITEADYRAHNARMYLGPNNRTSLTQADFRISCDEVVDTAKANKKDVSLDSQMPAGDYIDMIRRSKIHLKHNPNLPDDIGTGGHKYVKDSPQRATFKHDCKTKYKLDGERVFKKETLMIAREDVYNMICRAHMEDDNGQEDHHRSRDTTWKRLGELGCQSACSKHLMSSFLKKCRDKCCQKNNGDAQKRLEKRKRGEDDVSAASSPKKARKVSQPKSAACPQGPPFPRGNNNPSVDLSGYDGPAGYATIQAPAVQNGEYNVQVSHPGCALPVAHAALPAPASGQLNGYGIPVNHNQWMDQGPRDHVSEYNALFGGMELISAFNPPDFQIENASPCGLADQPWQEHQPVMNTGADHQTSMYNDHQHGNQCQIPLPNPTYAQFTQIPPEFNYDALLGWDNIFDDNSSMEEQGGATSPVQEMPANIESSSIEDFSNDFLDNFDFTPFEQTLRSISEQQGDATSSVQEMSANIEPSSSEPEERNDKSSCDNTEDLVQSSGDQPPSSPDDSQTFKEFLEGCVRGHTLNEDSENKLRSLMRFGVLA